MNGYFAQVYSGVQRSCSRKISSNGPNGRSIYFSNKKSAAIAAANGALRKVLWLRFGSRMKN